MKRADIIGLCSELVKHLFCLPDYPTSLGDDMQGSVPWTSGIGNWWFDAGQPDGKWKVIETFMFAASSKEVYHII